MNKILLMEDDRIVSKVHTRFLERAGYYVEVCDKGEDAFKAWVAMEIKEEPFNLVIIDGNMPDIEGYKVARRIRNNEKIHNWKRTPLLMLSASMSESIDEWVKEGDIDKGYQKPVHPDLLIKTVKDLIK